MNKDQVHNPENIDPRRLQPGYRFLSRAEVKYRDATELPDHPNIFRFAGKNHDISNFWRGDCGVMTYFTDMPAGYFLHGADERATETDLLKKRLANYQEGYHRLKADNQRLKSELKNKEQSVSADLEMKSAVVAVVDQLMLQRPNMMAQPETGRQCVLAEIERLQTADRALTAFKKAIGL